ncbi:DUF3107 domain-containing protein [Gardnerella vaginalis]|uniref:DUF3107 domain-containing protein n=1 Tax=Gardnerella vaginalis TaxID=2702 RepID=A0A133NM44_GARVA|nr:DUF3107 domain-containing protein [Gardnerella vaginalis]KXA17337.1 hypothetical protein HMPREF3216_01227 [Gardnerella vaginalis]
MKVTIGIKHVNDTISFESNQSEQDVQNIIENAVKNDKAINLTDKNNRKIFIMANSFAYAIIGDTPTHTVGFNAL